MNRLVFLGLLVLCNLNHAYGRDTQCLADKYSRYIDASLTWYQDLVALTTESYPDLADVGQWFYAGRTHHFELNRAAVSYYLTASPEKVSTEKSVESWLTLDQPDIKTLASRQDALGELAKKTYADRQVSPHPDNYKLRTAFAELLSHPDKIDAILRKYNQSISQLDTLVCQ